MPVIAAAFAAIGAAIGSAAAVVGSAVTALLGGGTLAAGIGGAIASVGATLGGFVATLGGASGLASAIGAWVGVASVATAIFGQPHLNSAGSQVAFKADINAGIPYVAGRTGVGGNIVFQDVSDDTDHKVLHFIAVLSHGPVTSIDQFSASIVPVTFNPASPFGTSQVGLNFRGAWSGVTQYQINDGVSSGGSDYIAVASSLNVSPPNASFWAPITINSGHPWLGKMNLVNKLGAQPETAFPAVANLPEIGSSFILSGLAASHWYLTFDADAYSAGVPKPLWVLKGPPVYDPRLDSTYPGGSGTQRSNDETTWAYADNPFLHGLAWLIGRKNNGIKVLGLGIPIGAIDVAAYVNGANVADANGWKISGQVFSTDSKWDVLVGFLQAGCGKPMRLGAKVSCLVNAPLVSIATLTGADAIGAVSVQTTTKRSERINRVIPSYRSETHQWNMVPAAAVDVSAYHATDNGIRTKALDWPLVADVNQVSVFARYFIEDSREFGPIQGPFKPQWFGLQPGDGVTLNEPEWGLNSQLCLCLSRQIDPTQGVPTLTFRSETTAKHALALGTTGTAPPNPAITGLDLTTITAPGSGVWTAASTTLSDPGTLAQVPAITLTGAIDNAMADGIVVQWSPAGAGTWSHLSAAASATSIVITGLTPNTSYDVQVAYLQRGAQSAFVTATGSPISSGQGATYNQPFNQTTDPAAGNPAFPDGPLWFNPSNNNTNLRVNGSWSFVSHLTTPMSDGDTIYDSVTGGSTTVTVPANALGHVDIFVFGGGGGAGGIHGGGGGGYCYTHNFAVTPGTTSFTVAIGTAGLGAKSGITATAGGVSSVSSGGLTTMTAGPGGSGSTSAGAAGTSSGGAAANINGEAGDSGATGNGGANLGTGGIGPTGGARKTSAGGGNPPGGGGCSFGDGVKGGPGAVGRVVILTRT